jgi:lariat debranching enzyme
VPRRYRRLVDFHAYYSGERTAPVLTLVIGGNHEASNYFFELYHGGWLAPNIYYLGAAGVVRYGPWRIAGLSGIYKSGDYRRPHYERVPYDSHGIRSVYHVREYDVEKLLQVTGQVDVCLSHDWPMWVELFGDYTALYKTRPHFLDSAKAASLGSLPALQVLGRLRPRYWFSGHMHVRFGATVEHKDQPIEDTIRELPISEPIRSKLPIFQRQASSRGGDAVIGETEFLGLSKPGSDTSSYIELMELHLPAHGDEEQYLGRSTGGKFSLHYDEEWLAITRAFNRSLRIPDPETLVVPPERHKKKVSSASIGRHREWVRENVTKKDLLKIPENFERHALVHDPALDGAGDQPPEYPNSQTARLAELLQMTNRLAMVKDESQESTGIDLVDFTLDE